jgi:tetratricopeptide (TPR) repeat protein
VAWTKKREYSRALADLDKAISLEGVSKIEAHAARAGVYEAQGKAELAIAELRKATEVTPRNVFDGLTQANIKKRIEELGKRNPCGGAGRGTGGDTCL